MYLSNNCPRVQAFFKMNTQILLTGGPALEKILVHLRDNVDSPCLLHCTGLSLTPAFFILQAKNSSRFFATRSRKG